MFNSKVSSPSYANARNDNEPEEEEREDENKKPFDERAYLAGRIPLVSGGPINPALFDRKSTTNAITITITASLYSVMYSSTKHLLI